MPGAIGGDRLPVTAERRERLAEQLPRRRIARIVRDRRLQVRGRGLRIAFLEIVRAEREPQQRVVLALREHRLEAFNRVHGATVSWGRLAAGPRPHGNHQEIPMFRTLRIAAAALVAASIPFAHAQKEREVAIGLQAAITSIDPHYHNLSPNNSLLQHIFEPLIRRDANQKLCRRSQPPGGRSTTSRGSSSCARTCASTTALRSPPRTWCSR
jgi:hypothetical protein